MFIISEFDSPSLCTVNCGRCARVRGPICRARARRAPWHVRRVVHLTFFLHCSLSKLFNLPQACGYLRDTMPDTGASVDCPVPQKSMPNCWNTRSVLVPESHSKMGSSPVLTIKWEPQEKCVLFSVGMAVFTPSARARDAQAAIAECLDNPLGLCRRLGGRRA